MLTQTLPSAAETYRRNQAVELAAAVRAVNRRWRRMGRDFDADWARIAPTITAIMVAAQRRIATEAVSYVPNVLEDTGQTRAIASAAQVNPAAVVGVTGAGYALEDQMRVAVIRAKQGVEKGLTPSQALISSGKFLSSLSGTILSDTGRAVEAVGMYARPVGGYVRMLNPPSCSRCTVLAGRYYRKNQGFQRHPGCDCRHIPASEAVAGDIRLDPEAYFNSLPTAAKLAEDYPDLTVAMRRELNLYSQEDVFTAAGAKAIRDGADISRVVNARRGMTTAQQNPRGWIPSGRMVPTDLFGRQVFITKEAVTGRSVNRPVRLMPESIYTIARDRDDLLRLLKAHGFIL